MWTELNSPKYLGLWKKLWTENNLKQYLGLGENLYLEIILSYYFWGYITKEIECVLIDIIELKIEWSEQIYKLMKPDNFNWDYQI